MSGQISLVVVPAVTQENHADRLRQYINRMPSLSTTMTKVMDICNDPSSTPSLLKQVISIDPVLTGSVIKLINSAYYGLPNRVASLTRAIILLGVNTVKNLAMAVCILGIVQKNRIGHLLNMDDYWVHSLAVGVIAKAIAKLLKASRSELEIHFVAGLLHDLGKLPLIACFPEQYTRAVLSVSRQKISLFEIENQIFGTDHAVVGRMIAEKWNLDSSIRRAIAEHHNLMELNHAGDLVSITVRLANTVAYQFEFGSAGDHARGASSLAVLAHAHGVEPVSLLGMKPAIEQEIEKAKIFLQLSA